MTTPTYYSSYARAIQEAYENAGYTAVGQRPSGEQWARGMNKLNTILMYLQTKGLKLFTWSDITLTLTSASQYAVGPSASGISMTKPLELRESYFLNSSGNKVPLNSISWNEWTRLPISSPGQPTNIFVDKQPTVLNINLWPAPDTTSQGGSVHLIFQTPVAKGVSLTDNIGFPEEWFLCIMWTLADELCIGRPAPIQEKCKANRERYAKDAEDFDVENTSIRFAVDTQGGMYGSEFR